MDLPRDFRSGYVALIGRPNAGKSTLLNQLLKFKLSIVTRKPQTTRKNVLGILSDEHSQIVFMDTPGLIEPQYDLQKMMMKYLESALEDADVIIYLLDVTASGEIFTAYEEQIFLKEKPVILALNKVDLIQKEKLLPLIENYQGKYNFESIIPISALKNDGLDRLVKELVHSLPFNPPYFPPEYVTDQQERFFVSEIIREKIFELYSEEVPYSCHVQIEEFRERPQRKDYIRAVIYVDRISQKGILIGKRGQSLKRVGELSRNEIESFLERPVFLELYVKVMGDWRRKPSKLKSLGY
ncbi:MAG: GTPase Era [Calditrichia bacterium]